MHLRHVRRDSGKCERVAAGTTAAAAAGGWAAPTRYNVLMSATRQRETPRAGPEAHKRRSTPLGVALPGDPPRFRRLLLVPPNDQMEDTRLTPWPFAAPTVMVSFFSALSPPDAILLPLSTITTACEGIGMINTLCGQGGGRKERAGLAAHATPGRRLGPAL